MDAGTSVSAPRREACVVGWDEQGREVLTFVDDVQAHLAGEDVEAPPGEVVRATPAWSRLRVAS